MLCCRVRICEIIIVCTLTTYEKCQNQKFGINYALSLAKNVLVGLKTINYCKMYHHIQSNIMSHIAVLSKWAEPPTCSITSILFIKYFKHTTTIVNSSVNNVPCSQSAFSSVNL